MESASQTEAFITLKDHKPNFYAAPSTRLINPNKAEIGVASKAFIEKIVKSMRAKAGNNQWTNGPVMW